MVPSSSKQPRYLPSSGLTSSSGILSSNACGVLDGNAVCTFLLSVNLGVMNLLPIPALDGGRLVFLILEAIRGKAIPQEKESMVHFTGFVLLMGLMAVILFSDLHKLFIK